MRNSSKNFGNAFLLLRKANTAQNPQPHQFCAPEKLSLPHATPIACFAIADPNISGDLLYKGSSGTPCAYMLRLTCHLTKSNNSVDVGRSLGLCRRHFEMTFKIQSGYRRLRSSRLGRAPFFSLSNATMLCTLTAHRRPRACASVCENLYALNCKS